MNLKRTLVRDLLHSLWRQTSTGAHTVSACAQGCGNGARAGNTCSQCIDDELLRRGIDVTCIRYERVDGRIRRVETEQ